MIRVNEELLAYLTSLESEAVTFFIEESYSPKSKIIDQDKRYSWVYFIKKGITKCYLSDEKGQTFVQEFLGAGMSFGEIEVFSKKPSYCCIEALTEVITYKISYTNFSALLENDKFFNSLIMHSLAFKISYKAPRHALQLGYSIEDNIINLYKEFTAFTRIISKQDIANFLGINVRSLNRAIKNLKDSGRLK